MAQLVAHLLCKQGVRGSSPLGSTTGQRPFPLTKQDGSRPARAKVSAAGESSGGSRVLDCPADIQHCPHSLAVVGWEDAPANGKSVDEHQATSAQLVPGEQARRRWAGVPITDGDPHPLVVKREREPQVIGARMQHRIRHQFAGDQHRRDAVPRQPPLLPYAPCEGASGTWRTVQGPECKALHSAGSAQRTLQGGRHAVAENDVDAPQLSLKGSSDPCIGTGHQDRRARPAADAFPSCASEQGPSSPFGPDPQTTAERSQATAPGSSASTRRVAALSGVSTSPYAPVAFRMRTSPSVRELISTDAAAQVTIVADVR